MIKKIYELRERKINILLFWIIFLPFIGLLLFGKVIFWGTASLQFIPWYQFSFDTILSGNFPLWNPYNGMGVPFIANYQSAVFYPINWLLLIFYAVGRVEGLTIGVTLLIPLHLFIGGLGIKRILERLNRSKFSQLMGGIAFAFSGYILTRVSFISMVWAYAWLPWIIFSCMQIKPITKPGSIPKLLQLSIFLALQLLAGHAQTTYYTILLSGIFVLFYEFSSIISQLKKILSMVIALIISLTISSIQILPTIEFLMQSQRSAEVGYDFAVSLSLWPARLLTILFGNFWGNPNYGRFMSGGNFWEENIYAGVFPVITIIILIWTLVWKSRRNQISGHHKRIISFLFAILIFSILFSFGKFFPLFPFLYNSIPTFDLFQAPVRFLIIYFFAFSILFGYGLDIWINSIFNHKKTLIILVVFGTLTIISMYGKIISSNFPDALITSVFSTGMLGLMFGILSLFKDKSWINLSLSKSIFGVIVLVDLLIHNFLWENFQSIQTYSNINQNISNGQTGRVFISAQDEEFLKFNSFFRPDRLQPILNVEKITPNFIPDTNLLNNRYAMINNFDPLQPEKLTKFWVWLNSLDGEKQNAIISLVAGNKKVSIEPSELNFIVEQEIEAKELIQWYGCAWFIDESGLLPSLLISEANDSENRCVFVDDPSLSSIDKPKNTNPDYIQYSISSVNTFKVDYISQSPGWIVVRQNSFPGWKAVLDGGEELIIREVDYMFQGVFAPEGQHSVTFTYIPKFFSIGLILSISSIILIIIYAILYSFHRKSSKNELLSEHPNE